MATKKTTSAGTTGGEYSQDKSKGSRSPRCGSDNSDDQREEVLPSDSGGISAAAPRGPSRLAVQAVFWLIIWSLLFGVWKAGRAIITNGLPTIRIEWPDREKDATPLAKWVKKNRPGLEADYTVVGTELLRTAERLESGRLVGPIDAAADTIARVQPEVSDAAGWREFISALTGRFQGGETSALAVEYREAAGSFGVVKAVEALIDTGGIEHEEDLAESTAETGDAAGAVVSEGSDEVEDQPVAGGEDEIAAEKDRGNPGCPGGQCPTGTGYRYGGSYWGGTYPYYRLF